MRGGPYAAIALAVVSVSFASIFITWSTSPPITIALYRLAIACVLSIALDDYGFAESLLYADILAFRGGVMAVFYFLLGRRVRQRVALLDYAFLVYASATAVLLVYALAFRSSLAPVGGLPRELLLFTALAVVPQIGGHTLYNWALRWVTAPVVSLSLVGEPVGSSLLAWALLSQVPTVGVAVGAGLALLGIYLTAFGQTSRAPEILATRDVE